MAARHGDSIRALTLDLDDTLWPVWPAIQRAESQLHAWLAQHAVATARHFDVIALRKLREAVGAEHPEWGHDFTRMRRESLVRALTLAGDDPALAAPAFDVFFAARNRVELFDDALPALATLARRWPIVALTNGNADLHSIGLARYFTATVSAREFGVGKPDPRIFHEACRRACAQPHEVLHIGDDWALDVAGAHGAGLRSAWVRRAGDAAMPATGQTRADCVARDLHELVAWLQA
ncbi:MAG: HAD-IA family hydrolase [Rhizobacter sp.]|nr:HAD-IA family hydrolase [Rhizobacter sp.]